MSSKIITACDFDNLSSVLSLADQLDPQKTHLKIGKSVFTRYGINSVYELQKRGYKVFLDLKYHDIPKTVADAVRAASDLGVWLLTIHASGGRKMIEAATAAAAQCTNPPIVCAVSVLTSMNDSDLAEIGILGNTTEQVAKLTNLAYSCGVDGMICSPLEVKMVKSLSNKELLAVTPGIRSVSDNKDDQKRTMSPQDAVKEGSDFLVIGRPITKSNNPLQSLLNIANEIEQVQK